MSTLRAVLCRSPISKLHSRMTKALASNLGAPKAGENFKALVCNRIPSTFASPQRHAKSIQRYSWCPHSYRPVRCESLAINVIRGSLLRCVILALRP